jgi:hypothetical protein
MVNALEQFPRPRIDDERFESFHFGSRDLDAE